MISALMEFVNALGERQRAGSYQTATFHQALETLLALLAPAAPHIADELWQITGHPGSVHQQPWPLWDAEIARQEMIQVPVQVDGKLREVLQVAADAEQSEVENIALAQAKVQQHLAGRSIAKMIYIPGKALSIVTAKQG